MVNKFLRKKSKRVPARKRYKIEKKVREHNRKLRKGDKKTKHKKKRLTLPNLIPNECPFKDSVIEEFQKMSEVERLERIRQKSFGNKNELQNKAEDAKQKFDEFAEVEKLKNAIELQTVEKELSLKTHYREFKKVFEAADVLLHVLDARDPIGTRCIEIEEAVRSASEKRLIYLLNKADLIPRDNLDMWLNYFRKFAPCISFKASLQMQRSHLGQRKFHGINEKSMGNSVSAGGDLVMSLLNNYCRNKNIKTSITVGVVGLPNVGKSSVINSLKRSRACDVGAMAGVTKNLQIVKVDSKIQIIDSPGVVFTSVNKSCMNAAESLALKNAMNPADIEDPIASASLILQKIDRNQLIDLYGIKEFQTPEQFLTFKAKQMGKVKKGGIPDLRAVSIMIIDDWNRGKIKHFTIPPEVDESDIHLGAEIVQEASKEFDIDNMIVDNVEPMEVTESIPLKKGGTIEIDGKIVKIIGTLKKLDQKKKMKRIGQKLKKLKH